MMPQEETNLEGSQVDRNGWGTAVRSYQVAGSVFGTFFGESLVNYDFMVNQVILEDDGNDGTSLG